MKVKVGTQVFDSDKEPILLVLDSEEKELISNMGDQTKFCSFPEKCRIDEINDFIKEDLK